MNGIVINQQRYKVEFVMLNEDKTPKFYELKLGETIIEQDWGIANSMNRPQWNGSEWIETLTLPDDEGQQEQPHQNVILSEKVTALEEKVAILENTVNSLVAADEPQF